jgi:hypothetical protein
LKNLFPGTDLVKNAVGAEFTVGGKTYEVGMELVIKAQEEES